MIEPCRVTATHAIDIADGRPGAPGQVIPDVDVDHPHNRTLIDAGLLCPETPTADTQLTGQDLKARAAELNIPNRTKLNADELRQAIADEEARLAAEAAGDGEDTPNEDGEQS